MMSSDGGIGNNSGGGDAKRPMIAANRRRQQRRSPPPSSTANTTGTASSSNPRSSTTAAIKAAETAAHRVLTSNASTPRYPPPPPASSKAYDSGSWRSSQTITHKEEPAKAAPAPPPRRTTSTQQPNPPPPARSLPSKNHAANDDDDENFPSTDELEEESQLKKVMIITLLPSSKKRPIPVPRVASTYPPRLVLDRPLALLATSSSPSSSSSRASLHHQCLDGSAQSLVPRMGLAIEHWKIHAVKMPAATDQDKNYPDDKEEEEEEVDSLVAMSCYYGAPVRLQNHRGEYLNVTATAVAGRTTTTTTTTPSDEHEHDDELSNPRALSIAASTTWDDQDPSTIWTLHPGTENEPIPVGPGATATSSPSDPVVGPLTIRYDRPVRMAQPFCLRNAEWNGILQNSTLQLLTDAHEQPQIVELEDFDVAEHPMGRLWQAHLFLPSICEVWYAQELPDPDYRGAELLEDRDSAALEEALYGRVVPPEPQRLPPSFDTSAQETILLDELLGACMGLSGEYIQFDGEKYRLLARQNNDNNHTGQQQPWDTILHTTVTDLLEIPNAYKSVDASLRWQRHHDCPVRRALYEELQDWLDEYLDIVLAQYRAFRESKLSIHTLQALHGARKTLNTMVQICQLSTCGGALIRRLPKIPRLLRAVMAPYQEQLQTWLTQGRLIAPEHFMIQKNSNTNCTTWEEKYIVHEEHVLVDLLPTDRIVQQTLATGRYWNAVRVCQTIPSVENSSEEMAQSLTSFIERQHGEASMALKSILLPDLRPSLQLIQDYFLMFKADMFLDFLEKASTELGKDIELISRHRMQHFFNEPKIQCFFQRNNNISTTTSSTIKNNNNNSKTVNGLDTFAIRLTNVSYPSTIMLTRNVMLQYSSLFRHLFKVKFTEQKLLSVWKDHQLTKDLSILPLLTSTFALRHRMLHFINNLEYYLRYEVIEVQWGKFLLDMNKDSNTVDDMLAVQRRFLDNVLEACMLKDRKARLALTVLVDTCILFTTQMDYFHDATKLKVLDPSRRRLVANDSSPPSAEMCRERLEMAQELREQRRDIQSSRLEQGATAASYRSMVNRFSDAFDRRLKDFVATLSTQHVSLYTRLNFNGFMSGSADAAPLNGNG